MTSNVQTTRIFMPLLNEGTDCWCAVNAKEHGEGVFEVLGIIPAGEEWQFAPVRFARPEADAADRQQRVESCPAGLSDNSKCMTSACSPSATSNERCH